MPLAETWVDLERIILSKVSQTVKDKYYMIMLIHSDQKKWYKWTYIQNRNRRGDICTPMADSCWCMEETNTTLESNCPPIKNKLYFLKTEIEYRKQT